MTKYCLVIDDDQFSREILAGELKALGIFPIQASSLDLAFEILKESTFDGIFLDLVLDNESGLEFLEMRQDFDERLKRIPVIVTSARADHFSIAKAIAMKADGYLIKPILTSALKNVLRKCSILEVYV